ARAPARGDGSMKSEQVTLDALIEALADGSDIDWSAAEAHAGSDRGRYRNLRLVARVAELHRTLGAEDEERAPAVDAAPAVEIPGTWGELQVRTRLAAGPSGDVLLARDPALDREVALKLLRRPFSAREPLDWLLAEARTLARVQHPNVVVVHGAAIRDGRAGLWMEL